MALPGGVGASAGQVEFLVDHAEVAIVVDQRLVGGDFAEDPPPEADIRLETRRPWQRFAARTGIPGGYTSRHQ